MAEEINGVPCDKLFGSIAKTRENGELARFRFSAKYSAVFDALANPTEVNITRRS